MPVLSATSDTVITIHYGNDDIDAATANPAGVWDGNFKGVWHLKESATAIAAEFFRIARPMTNHGHG